MMNSAPAVVGASDGLAAFRSIIAKRGPALAWARGAALHMSWTSSIPTDACTSPVSSTRSRRPRCIAVARATPMRNDAAAAPATMYLRLLVSGLFWRDEVSSSGTVL